MRSTFNTLLKCVYYILGVSCIRGAVNLAYNSAPNAIIYYTVSICAIIFVSLLSYKHSKAILASFFFRKNKIIFSLCVFFLEFSFLYLLFPDSIGHYNPFYCCYCYIDYALFGIFSASNYPDCAIVFSNFIFTLYPLVFASKYFGGRGNFNGNKNDNFVANCNLFGRACIFVIILLLLLMTSPLFNSID